MFTAVSRALHFSSESGASRPRDCRFYKHCKGSVLRVSYLGKIVLGENVVLVELKKSGLVVVLYRGGKSYGRYPVASFGRSIWGCSGGEQKEKKSQNSRKETHDCNKTGGSKTVRLKGKRGRSKQNKLGEKTVGQ